MQWKRFKWTICFFFGKNQQYVARRAYMHANEIKMFVLKITIMFYGIFLYWNVNFKCEYLIDTTHFKWQMILKIKDV